MHVALMRGKNVTFFKKSSQAKRRIDSTTTRNVYHNLTGKYQSIKGVKLDNHDLANR